MAAESTAYKQLAGSSKTQLPGFFESVPKSNFRKVKVRVILISYYVSVMFLGSDTQNLFNLNCETPSTVSHLVTYNYNGRSHTICDLT